MKEGDFTRQFVKELRTILPGSVVFKHADTLTGGIPDLSITWQGHTTWVEVKIVRGGRTWFTALQSQNCFRLAREGRCLVVQYDVDRDSTQISTPDSSLILRSSSFGYQSAALLLKTCLPIRRDAA
jgi:hypothetical protein